MSLRTRLGRLETLLPRKAPREPREAILARLNAKLDAMRGRMGEPVVPPDPQELRSRIMALMRRPGG